MGTGTLLAHLEISQEQRVVHQRDCVEDVKLGLVGQDNRVADEIRQSTFQEPMIIRILYKGGFGRVVIEIGSL